MMKTNRSSVPPLWPWATDVLLPFWAESGFHDAHGCFVEQFTLDGVPHDPGFTRIRVQARQTYVFAHAHHLGAGDYALPRARDGFAFLRRCWNDDTGGFPMRVSLDAEILEPTIDLYDHAFALLAMAWLHQATGEPEPIEWAERILGLLVDRMADPAGGFVEQLPVDDRMPRRQNPHMHLLEAFLATHAATADPRWLTQADTMVGLLIDHFLDDGGTLGEFFDADWQPRPGAEGGSREPGHHFEWVWLLNRYQAQGGERPVKAIADRLMAFGSRHGIDDSDDGFFAAFDEVWRDGTIARDSKRLWPQTEAIRAFAVMHAWSGDPGAANLVRRLFQTMFSHYLTVDSGILRDGLSRDGSVAEAVSPSSSLYHLWGAIVEALKMPDL